jgi:hypothetical protein
MYKRLELHNHTKESDGNMTPLELIQFMRQDKVDAFAITDHNTISGHQKIKGILCELGSDISCIYGMEYTTYYGHILCFNLNEYVPWENININKPELLFQAVKKRGALTGIAHPFSKGHPFARGCRFDMNINDYHSFDFIEIINNSQALNDVNKRGLQWWEELVLKGYPLACTSGMDLHKNREMKNQFATFIEGDPDGSIEKELKLAIQKQRTWVSKGPILETNIDHNNEKLTFSIVNTKKPGYHLLDFEPYYLTLKTKKGDLTEVISIENPLTISFSVLAQETIILPKLYYSDTTIDNLIVVAPTIYL